MQEDLRNPIVRACQRPIRWMQIAGGWALVAICFATLYDIVARRLIGHSMQGVNEVGAYLLAIVSAFGFSSALLQKAHSRVDFLFAYLPKPVPAWLNAAAAVLLAAMGVFSAWQGWIVLRESFEFSSRAPTPLQTPLWIPQSLWLMGLAAFAALALACAIHAVWLLARDQARLNALYGPLSTEGQIAVETQGGVTISAEIPAAGPAGAHAEARP